MNKDQKASILIGFIILLAVVTLTALDKNAPTWFLIVGGFSGAWLVIYPIFIKLK